MQRKGGRPKAIWMRTGKGLADSRNMTISNWIASTSLSLCLCVVCEYYLSGRGEAGPTFCWRTSTVSRLDAPQLWRHELWHCGRSLNRILAHLSVNSPLVGIRRNEIASWPVGFTMITDYYVKHKHVSIDWFGIDIIMAADAVQSFQGF